MAQPKTTSVYLLLLLSVLTFEALLPITEGIPQHRLRMHHLVKRNVEVSDNKDYQDDYYNYDDDQKYNDNLADNPEGYDEEEEGMTVDPEILTKGNTYTVDKGTTIRLPCYVDKFPRGAYTIMWRRAEGDPNNYLVLGKNIMDRNQAGRMQVELVNDEDIKQSGSSGSDDKSNQKGSTLLIPTAKDEDEGQYICIVPRATGEVTKIKHTVSIRDPPTITKDPSNGLLKVNKGDSVTMACYGEGRPKPTVKWHRFKNKLENKIRMPDGSMEMETDELSFANVDRHHSGIYECVADNGYGQPASQQIELEVEYAPEVEAQEIFVHAKSGNNVELVCNVHAHPTPIVKWFKNRMELTDETAQLKQHGHRHILNIPSVDKNDFGNYTCRATNSMGEDQQVLEISGKAGFAKFESTPKGTEPESFIIEWTSESHSDIQQFELKWKEHGASSWHSETIYPIKKNSFEWMGKHAIQGLKPATRFEATVAAQNDEDWSRHSPVYHFSTFGAEPLKSPSSSTTIQPFLSRMFSSRSQILLSVITAYLLTKWHNRL